ncbi:MAG: hypothetical protein ACRD1Z_01105 [Vicinamibacteria bacterium]
MSHKKLGQIPLVSKFLAKRRLKSLESKVDTLHDKFEGLKKEIISAKDKAADLLTMKNYGSLTSAIDTKVEKFCKTAGDIEDASEEIDIKKMCKESLHKQGKISRASGSGRLPTAEQKLVDDCLKKGTGSP